MRFEPTATANQAPGPAWPAGRERLFRLLGGQPGDAPPMFAAMVALPLLAATLMGGLIVFAELDALVLCLALLACAFIVIDFRIGVVSLILFMPLSASTLLPHRIGGIPGLDQLSLLLIGTVVAWLLHGRSKDSDSGFSTRPLIWLYVAPFVLAGAIGSRHLNEVAPALMIFQPETFDSVLSYVLKIMIRPLFLILFALLVAAAVARSRRPQLFVAPTLVSIWAMSLMTIVFTFLYGASVDDLASTEARRFLSPLGIHANDLGRLYVIAYALLLYTCAATKDAGLRLLLIVSMGVAVLALMLTFSRAGFFAFAVVNGLFLLSRRKFTTLLLGGMLLVIVVLLLPGPVIERVTSGWGGDVNTLSAGRVSIWLPLLPEIWRSPIVGSGLSSIGWSEAMRTGVIQTAGHAHNAYLKTVMDMGLLGLILLCAYLFHVWKGFRRLSIDPAIDPLLRGFYAGAAAGLVSFLLAGFFGSSLTPCTEQIYLWLAIGMMYGQQRLARETA